MEASMVSVAFSFKHSGNRVGGLRCVALGGVATISLAASACLGEAPSLGDDTAETVQALSWSGDTVVPNQTTWGTPAVAASGSNLLLVHNGGGIAGVDNTMWWSMSTAMPTGGDHRIPNEETSFVASRLAANGGLIYLLHKGDHSSAFWMSSFSPETQSWTSSDWQLPTWITSGEMPGLGSYRGSVVIVRRSDDSGGLLHMTLSSTPSNGNSWLDTTIPGTDNGSHPSLASVNGQLYLVYQGSDGVARLAIYNGVWTTPTLVPACASSTALAAFGGFLHFAHIGCFDNGIWDTDMNLSTGVWSPDQNTGLSASFGVSLAATAAALYLVHDSSARTKQILWAQLQQQ
jgi:hypothetical protein